MNNDLISRSALMQSLRNNILVDVTPNLEQAITEQPTAYDVDKVKNKFKEANNIQFQGYTKPLISVDDAVKFVDSGFLMNDKEELV